MTPQEFAGKHRVSVKTVHEWIAKGFIPGANDSFVPDSARRPYTKTRAKNGQAIIKSILTACDKGYAVCAALYGISDVEFEAYLQSLLDGGYITRFEVDGMHYYNITVVGVELLENWNKPDVMELIQVAIALIPVLTQLLPTAAS